MNQLLQTLDQERLELEQFLARRLGCRAAAQDVLQVLSEKLFKGQAGRTLANPRAFVFRAAANAAISHTRSENTRSTYEAAAARTSEDINTLHPERIMLGQEALDELHAALDQLPRLTKHMFLLHRVEGLSQKHIAAEFKVSLSTVEKRIAKATLHCHRSMRDEDVTGFASGPRCHHEGSKGSNG